MAISERFEQLTRKIIGAAMRIHSQLGPALLESVYEACLEYELSDCGLHVQRQKPLLITYREVQLEAGYRLDLLVEDAVVVEVKSVEALFPIHAAQLLTYLKLSGYHVGLLINFNVEHLRSGIRRIVHGLKDI